MEGSHNRLTIIRGGCQGKPYARRTKGEAEQLVCRTCEHDIGVATSEWLEIQIAPMIQGNEVKPGTPGLICVHCLSRGKVTRAT